MEFKLTKLEYKRARKFIQKHKHSEAQGKLGFSTLGHQFTYHITPGGLGYIVEIECNYCKKKENITDNSNW